MKSPSAFALAMVLALPVAPLVAQGSPTFGLLGGLTSSKISLDADEVEVTLGSRTGFAAGVSARFPISTLVSLEIDGLYAQKGFELSSDEGEGAELKLTYIEVPVLLSYEFGAASTRPFLLVGGTVSFKAGCDITGVTGGVSATLSCEDLVEAEQNSIDLGGTIGAGLRFNRLSLQARYTLGLTEVFKDDDESFKSKNRALFFLAGISF